MQYSDNYIFVAGVARTAKEESISHMYRYLSVGLVVDSDSDLIIDADCTMAMDLTRGFIRELLVGRNLHTGIDEIVKVIHRRFLGLSQKALIAALYDAQNHYLISRSQ